MKARRFSRNTITSRWSSLMIACVVAVFAWTGSRGYSQAPGPYEADDGRETVDSQTESDLMSEAPMVGDGELPSGCTIPAAPTGVGASDGTFCDQVRISWNGSADATYYEIWRNITNNSGSAVQIATGVTASPYDDATVTRGTTYYYWVKACNACCGCSGFSASNSGIARYPNSPSASASNSAYCDRIEVD